MNPLELQMLIATSGMTSDDAFARERVSSPQADETKGDRSRRLLPLEALNERAANAEGSQAIPGPRRRPQPGGPREGRRP